MIPIVENKLKIKLRKLVNKFLTSDSFGSQLSRRGKEKTIIDAVKFVGKWREMKHGEKRLSLEEVASKLDISKKTLDEYYRQIKRGIKEKFDFHYYRDHPIGMLRHFNLKNDEQ